MTSLISAHIVEGSDASLYIYIYIYISLVGTVNTNGIPPLIASKRLIQY